MRNKEQLKILIDFINCVKTKYLKEVKYSHDVCLCPTMIKVLFPKDYFSLYNWFDKLNLKSIWLHVLNESNFDTKFALWIMIHYHIREILPEFNPITCEATNYEAIELYNEKQWANLATTKWWKLCNYPEMDDIIYVRLNALHKIESILMNEYNHIKQ